MIVNIRGEKISITDAMRNQIESKCDKLKKYFENSQAISINIKIKVQNKSQTIEATIETKKFTVRAEETHEDLYKALDLVIDKIERQIRKNKTRIKNKFQSSEDINLNFELDNQENIEESKIIKRKIIEMKPMDEEEAIIQIELLNHDFFIFNNINEGCISVLYKRKKGNYGIINVK